MKWLFLFLISFPSLPFICSGQLSRRTKLFIPRDKLVLLRDTTFITRQDTTIHLSTKELRQVQIRESPDVKSNRFYDSLRSRASGRRGTKELMDFLIKKPSKELVVVTTVQKSEEPFAKYAHYTIGTISFKAVDLLEGSVIDTLQESSTSFAKFVNRVHKDTRSSIIEKNLLFKSGDQVDPYQLADNERILRQFRTLRDARILLTINDKKKKIVDVVVVTQDVASIGFSGDFSSLNKFRIDLYDINILGYAKQLQISYFRNEPQKPINGYSITLHDPNINGSFIQSEIHYTSNYERNKLRISLGRDFFTPGIKYAGGIELFTTKEKYYFENTDTLQASYRENQSDFWLGRSLEIKKRVNLITSLRINIRDFFERPYISKDSNSFFFDRTLLLGSVTLIKRNYLKSSLIRSFGKTEDISSSDEVTVTMGHEINEYINRDYLELRGSIGKYFPRVGYLYSESRLGAFKKLSTIEDGIFLVRNTYFSNLFKIRRVRARQFITINYTKGINRLVDKTLALEKGWTSKNSISPFGSQRLGLEVENVYFMHWYKLGFRFALYHKFSFNLLSADNYLFEERNFFSSIGTGIRMSNENFIFPAFSLDFNYFIGNKAYGSAFDLSFNTTLRRLFGNDQTFKPSLTSFN